MVEVTQLTNGAQVFADVTRTTTQIIIEFTNDAGNGDYSVLLNNVG